MPVDRKWQRNWSTTASAAALCSLHRWSLGFLFVCPQDRERVTPLMIKGFRDAAEEGGTSVTGGQTVINPWIIVGGVASVVCQPNEFIMWVRSELKTSQDATSSHFHLHLPFKMETFRVQHPLHLHSFTFFSPFLCLSFLLSVCSSPPFPLTRQRLNLIIDSRLGSWIVWKKRLKCSYLTPTLAARFIEIQKYL